MELDTEPTERRIFLPRHLLTPALTLVLGCALSAGAFVVLARQQAARDRSDIQARIAATVLAQQDQANRCVEALCAGASRANASPRLTRAEWERFAGSLDLEHHCPGFRAIGLVEAVSDSRVSSYVERARADGAPGFRLRDVPGAATADRPARGSTHYVVRYVEPRAVNAAMIGLDLAGEPRRREAAERARDTGEPVLVLAGDTADVSGPLVFLPWYAERAPVTTPAERRRALRGWVFGALSPDGFFAGALGGYRDELDLEVRGGDGAKGAAPVFSTAAAGMASGEAGSTTTTTRLFGQPLELRWSPRGTPLQRDGSPVAVGIAGAMASLLLAALLLSLANARERARRLLEARAASPLQGDRTAQPRVETAPIDVPSGEAARFDLRDTLEAVAESLAGRASRRNADVFVRYTPGTPRFVLGEESGVRAALLDLAGRALQAGDGTHVRLTALSDTDASGRSCVRVEVGEPFIGPGPALPVAGPDSAQYRFAPDTGVRVLVIDAAELPRGIMAEELEAAGAEVVTAPGPDDAVGMASRAAAAGTPYGLIVIGIGRDGRTAEGLARAVRIVSGARRPAILAVTSYGRRGEAQRFKTLGFDGMLVRPVRAAELLEAATVLLAASRTGEWPLFLTRYTLPSCATNGAPARREGEAEARPVRRVLLAEDNSVNQKVASRMLEALGCHVDIAANGSEAVDLARVNSYDLVLMDCHMPEKDGFEAAREIRLLPGGDEVPIVALTADALSYDRNRFLEAGMNDHVAKPVTREAIATAVVRWARAA